VDFGFSAEHERFREQVRAALRGPGVRTALAKAEARHNRWGVMAQWAIALLLLWIVILLLR